MQSKILRAIEERVVTPIGGKPSRFEARLIAATHRNLAERVTGGAFREDLYYRLNVVPIVLPPLRERREDILPLAEHSLAREARDGTPKRLSPSAAALLLEHSWPGNVRELRNVIARACVLVRGEVIEASDIDIKPPSSQTPARDELRDCPARSGDDSQSARRERRQPGASGAAFKHQSATAL
jgi:two-component system NtrC family response regulator